MSIIPNPMEDVFVLSTYRVLVARERAKGGSVVVLRRETTRLQSHSIHLCSNHWPGNSQHVSVRVRSRPTCMYPQIPVSPIQLQRNRRGPKIDVCYLTLWHHVIYVITSMISNSMIGIIDPRIYDTQQM